MRRLLKVLVLLVLCGCGGRAYQDSDYVTSKFEQQQLAVVVFKMRGRPSFIGASPRVSFDMVRIDKQIGLGDGKFCYHFSPGFFGKLNVWNKDYLYLMVEPGFYVIDHIAWSEGNVNYYTPKGAVPIANPVQFGAFEVKPGTVNYLGDLEVYCKNAALGINKTDNFDSAKAALEKDHPELAPRLIHADFLPAGYYIALQPQSPGDVASSESRRVD